jgi:hypothetical protein
MNYGSLRSSSSLNDVGAFKTRRRDLNMSKKELVDCVKDLYWMGLTTSISGNHSIRFRNKWMWITPSGISRYKIHSNHLVKVHLKPAKCLEISDRALSLTCTEISTTSGRMLMQLSILTALLP